MSTEEISKPGPRPETDNGPVGTLARGLTVLRVVVDSPQPLTLAEIAVQCGLDQSTTLRLLRALEESAYVLRTSGLKRYLPSPRAIRPLSLLHPIEQFRRDTAKLIADLAVSVSQTVVLALFIDHERLVVDIAQHPGSLSPYYDTWLKGPVHATGVGKALLLTMDAAARKAFLGPEPFKRHTPHTITGLAALEADLAAAEERGYVLTRDEYKMGLTAMGSLIRTWNGHAVGCLVVTGHTSSLQGGKLAETGEAILRAAQLVPYQATSLRLLEQLCGSRFGQAGLGKGGLEQE